MDLEQGTVRANGLEFAYLAAGPEGGPLALCFHGFPDTAWGFRHLLPALAEAGYRAVAPFMRGYAPTAIPAEPRYSGGMLALDAIALHEALGGDERAVLIGHDWGATAVYPAVGHQPDRWRRAVTLAVPPGPALAGGLLQYDQIKRSFYMWFFQLPLAEVIVPVNNLEFIARLWADWSPGYDAGEDLDHVRASLGNHENLLAALGYYRAAFTPGPPDTEAQAVQMAGATLPLKPLLYLHGADDGCIGVSMAEAAKAMLQPPSEAVIVEGTGHFLHLEKPAEVNRLILDFLAKD